MGEEIEKVIQRLTFKRDCLGITNGDCIVNGDDIGMVLKHIEELKVYMSTNEYNWQNVDENRMKINEIIRVVNKIQLDNKIKEK